MILIHITGRSSRQRYAPQRFVHALRALLHKPLFRYALRLNSSVRQNMYRIPKDLDLSKIVGKSTTQIHVGQYDIQFSFGEVDFQVESEIHIVCDGDVIGEWRGGHWPSPSFFKIMNVDVIRYETPDDRTIVIYLNGGLEIHMFDNSDQFECLQISIHGQPGPWII